MSDPLLNAKELLKQHDILATLIGRLFLAFGIAEYNSYEWIEKLSKDDVVKDLMISQQLTRRVALIERLVKRTNWREEKKQEAITLWKEVKTIADSTRNILAHNPVLVQQNKDGSHIFNVICQKTTSTIGSYGFQMVSPDDIMTKTERIHVIVEILFTILEPRDCHHEESVRQIETTSH